MKIRRCIIAAVVTACASMAQGAFAPNSIAVVQVGNGAQVFGASNPAQNLFIVQYDINTGAQIGSVALNGVALDSKNDDADGHLNRTGNGQYLTLGAYATTEGSAYPVTANVPRAIVRVDGNGNVATASFSGIYAGQTINAVASTDGNSFFAAGSGPDSNSAGGLLYMPSLASATPVNVSQTQSGSKADSYRNARIISGQLYINTAAQGSFVNRGSYIMTLNNSLPAAAVNTASVANPVIVNTEGSLTDANGNVSPDATGKLYPKTDVAYLDTNNDGTFDRAYSTGGKEDLEKWTLSAGKWIRTDTIDAPPVTVQGQNNEINAIDYNVSASGVQLFLSNDFGIWKFTDTGGSGGFASPDITAATDSNVRHYLTTSYFVAPGVNEQFRGIAVLVPEPAALGLMAVVGAMALRRRRA